MVFIEAPIFSKYIYNYVDDEGYAALQQTLALRPAAGKVIPGSGGLRKLRWAGSGRGKRGGLRISTLEIIFCVFVAEISVDFEINFVKVLIQAF